MDSSRIGALGAVLAEEGIDAFFATSAITMGYLAGLFEDGHERFLTLAVRSTGDYRLICPSLTLAQAQRVGVDQAVGWTDDQDPLALFGTLAEDWNLRSGILAVEDEMRADMLLQMQAALPAALFRAGGPYLSRVAAVKSADEIATLRHAGGIADAAWEEVHPQIHAGMTENEVSMLLRDAMRQRGGIPTFTIVATGPNGAEPHHLSDDTPLRTGDVAVIDFGCAYNGYQSDITRTVAIGEPKDPDADRVYATVWQAHQAARATIRPGQIPADVDRAAREVIERAGFGPFFFHRTGHGLGMRGHEAPNIVSTNRTPLVAGNCFSIEPGVYLQGRFGVRIENIVVATDAGHQSMNDEPAPGLLRVG